jgi:hypothetical protein
MSMKPAARTSRHGFLQTGFFLRNPFLKGTKDMQVEGLTKYLDILSVISTLLILSKYTNNLKTWKSMMELPQV